MRVTIIVEDNTVYVDGKALGPIDCSSLTGIHAVQWYNTKGEVEYKVDEDGNKPPNVSITDFSPYESFVDEWNVRLNELQELNQKEK